MFNQQKKYKRKNKKKITSLNKASNAVGDIVFKSRGYEEEERKKLKT